MPSLSGIEICRVPRPHLVLTHHQSSRTPPSRLGRGIVKDITDNDLLDSLRSFLANFLLIEDFSSVVLAISLLSLICGIGTWIFTEPAETMRSKPSMASPGLKGSTSPSGRTGAAAPPSAHSGKTTTRSRNSRNSYVQTHSTSSTKTGRSTTETFYYKYSESKGIPTPLSAATTVSSEEDEYLSSASSSKDTPFESLSSSEAWKTMYSSELNELKLRSNRVDAIRKQKTAVKEKMTRLKREEEALARMESIGGWRTNVAASTSTKSSLDGVDNWQDKDWYKFVRKQLRGLNTKMEELSEEEKEAERRVRKAREAVDKIRRMEDSWMNLNSPPSTPIPSYIPVSPPKSPPTFIPLSPPQMSESRPLPTSSSSQSITQEYYYFSTSAGGKPQANMRRHTTDGNTFRATPPVTGPSGRPRSSSVDGIKTKPPTTGPSHVRRASVDLRTAYDERWTKFEERYGAPVASDNRSPASPQPLRFKSIPWPVVLQPTVPAHITKRAIESFLFPPSRSVSPGADDRKATIRNAIRRYHPDKFLTKYLSKVEESEKDNVKRGVEMVTRSLNEIMQAENARRS